MKQQVNGEKTKGWNGGDLEAEHKTDNNANQTIIVWTYLSGEHKQSDEEDKEGDRAHRLQIFENSWSWRTEKKKIKVVFVCGDINKTEKYKDRDKEEWPKKDEMSKKTKMGDRTFN